MTKHASLALVLPLFAAACAPPDAPPRRGSDAALKVKAESLSADYGRDPKAADALYGGRRVELQGVTCEPNAAVVAGIAGGRPAVLLQGQGGPRVRCFFRKGEGEKIRHLGPSNFVLLTGRVRPWGDESERSNLLFVDDCKVLD